MSNIISKIRQRIALKKDNKFNLSCDHITTSDFYKLSPVYFKEMVPGEKINIKMATFSRLSPMVKPMYGRARIENRAFFVPMRTIFKGWNEFITDTPYNNLFLKVPQLYPEDITTALCDAEFSREVTASVASDFDAYTVSGSTVTHHYRVFTNVGKQAWNILCSLGYRYPIGYFSAHSATDTLKFSALPILAFFKIYKDWYKAQAYQTTLFDNIFEISANIATTSGRLTAAVLKPLLGLCGRVNYDKDYFSSAWDKPVTPNQGLSSTTIVPDITNDRTGTSGSYRDVIYSRTSANANFPTTPVVNTVPTFSSTDPSVQVSNLSQYALDALKALTDYMKRHQLAGGLAMDRMLARFGVKPSDAALDRSVYIGKNTVDIQIADVMATANGESTIDQTTNKSALGEYAGKGVAFGSDGFNYSTNEYGYIIVLSSIVPRVGYVQGCSRYTLHKDKLDFFTPEFDSLGVQAIARKELLSDYNNAEDNLENGTAATLLDGVFGYTSRYAEYKTQQDNLTGDFTCASLNEGMDTWHLNRLINPAATGFSVDKVSHNLNFVRPSDASQYDRVFAYQGTDYDHFYNIYHFEITDYAPMAQLFDDYEFDGGSKDVTIDINGTQLN